MVSWQPSGPQKPLTTQGLVGILALFTALCTIFALIATAVDAWNEHAQRSWSVATATIDRCSVDSYRPLGHGGLQIVWHIQCRINYLADGDTSTKIRSRSASSSPTSQP